MKRRYAGTAAALVRPWCRLPGRETPMEKTGYRCHGNTTSAIAPVSWRIVRREVGPGFKSMPFLPQAVCPPLRGGFSGQDLQPGTPCVWARSPGGFLCVPGRDVRCPNRSGGLHEHVARVRGARSVPLRLIRVRVGNAPVIDPRQSHQDHRIDQGIAGGRSNQREVNRLETQQQHGDTL